ncbi:Rieske (2Fe-2S) protein [Pseudonocardia nematodicida]|uniref:Cytochrome bc1 complex Rieske iron-sulfur subunit n=1 Tax=Pseudonocardia nematodicida TaxID=1206997 RepID=A0ABV1K9E8_9PSEU
MSPITPSPTRGLTRRGVLAGAGALGACCAAGCATYGTPNAGPAPEQESGGDAAAPPPGDDGSLAAVDDIPVGGGLVFADQGVVVTQPQAGTFAAFDAACTHQGCLVDQVTDAGITCPCHGSVFDLADGSPLAGPANGPLGERGVTVDGDRILLA